MRKRLMTALALLAGALGSAAPPPASAGPAEEARRLYGAFVAAQNAHDFAAVRATLLDSPRFLWVSNGLSIWGVEPALRRMMGYHGAEIWRIDPLESRAVAVEAGPGSAFLHIPLELTFGERAAPVRFRILVTALCVATPTGWRIAGLFTTDANPEGGWPE